MKAMILAAGRGERMRPLTDSAPKPLLAVADKPLIQYHIESLVAAGIQDILVNLAWKGEMIREQLGHGEAFGARIAYSDEGDAALETGGGVFKALPLLGEKPFLVVSGDVWTDYPFAKLANVLMDSDVAHLIVVPNPDFHTRGDFALQGTRFVQEGARYTYANIGVFRPQFFEECRPGKFALAPLMFSWIARNRVSGELFEGGWRNVGTPEQLKLLDSELRSTHLSSGALHIRPSA
ncbi:MAG: N-acetylmuramate alpha-1-phosphate uridylyltransferase MurU [Povalibacter sp.]